MPLPSFAHFWDIAEVIALKVTASDKADTASSLRRARERLGLNVDVKAMVIERFGPIEGRRRMGMSTQWIELSPSFHLVGRLRGL